MIIGFTGTQKGMTGEQKKTLLEYLDFCKLEKSLKIFIHGDCLGADEEAHKIAKQLKLLIIIHPSIITRKRALCIGDETLPPRPPIERDKNIVRSCHELVVAPRIYTEIIRSGTWTTYRYAKKIVVPRFVIWPNGLGESK